MKTQRDLNEKYIWFLILVGVISSSFASSAMSQKEVCELRGKLFWAIATERDKGIPQRDVVNLLHKKFAKYGLNRNTFNETAGLIYSRPDISPEIVAKVGLLSCLQDLHN